MIYFALEIEQSIFIYGGVSVGRVRGTVVLKMKPDACTAVDVAKAVAVIAGGVLTSWELSSTLPSGLDVATEDQLSATLRDNPQGCVMIVWADDGSDELDD